MVIKVDMEKACDRVAWNFITEVLRKFGFAEEWIDLICRLISYVWYSIIINGTRKGFFSSSQGLKQGDPLSPSLFVLGAEVLSRMLNKLFHNTNFTLFSMNLKGPVLNHLAYADDVVIFMDGNNISLKLVMTELKRYEEVSGQMVNQGKSFFLNDPKASASED